MKYINKYATVQEMNEDYGKGMPNVAYTEDLRAIWYNVYGTPVMGNINQSYRTVIVDGVYEELTSTDLSSKWLNRTDIQSINFNQFAPTSLYRTFKGCTGLWKQDSVSGLDYSKVLNAREAFTGCSFRGEFELELPVATNIRSICQDMPNCEQVTLTAPNAEDCQYIFERYSAPSTPLTSVYLYVEKNKAQLKQAFYNQNNLTSVTLDGGINDPNFTVDCRQMFDGCYSLKTLSGWMNCTNVTAVGGMFNSCTALNSIDASIFDNLGAGFPTESAYPTNFVLDISMTDISDPAVPEGILNALGTTICPWAEVVIYSGLYDNMDPDVIAAAEAKGWIITRHENE